jgi:putative transposase
METQTLTETQWEVIKKYLPNIDRKRRHDLRAIFDALFYILKTGCHWRMLPCSYPKWELVYYYFSRWRDEEVFVHLNDMTREVVRLKNNKKAQSSVAIIDSQSIKTTRRGGLRGIDGNKKIKGRKRHIMVDSMGNIITNIVHVANIHDSKGAHLVLKNLKENIHGIKVIYADCGYRGELIEIAKHKYDYTLKISPKIKDNAANKVSPKRWIVERTFAWLESFRRLSKDFEYLLESSQAMIYLASIKLLLNKI